MEWLIYEKKISKSKIVCPEQLSEQMEEEERILYSAGSWGAEKRKNREESPTLEWIHILLILVEILWFFHHPLSTQTNILTFLSSLLELVYLLWKSYFFYTVAIQAHHNII